MFDFLTNVVEKVEVVVARVRPMMSQSKRGSCANAAYKQPLAICHALFVADLLEAITVHH